MPGREHRGMPDDARSIRQPQLHAGGGAARFSTIVTAASDLENAEDVQPG